MKIFTFITPFKANIWMKMEMNEWREWKMMMEISWYKKKNFFMLPNGSLGRRDVLVYSHHHIFHFGQSLLLTLDISLFSGLQFNFTLFFIGNGGVVSFAGRFYHETVWCSQHWLLSIIPRKSVLIDFLCCLCVFVVIERKFIVKARSENWNLCALKPFC